FTNGHYLGVVQFAEQPVQRRRFAWRQVQRVDADRAVHIRVARCQRPDLGRIVGTYADAQEMPDTPCPRGIQRGIQGATMSGEVETVEVAMGIYKHGRNDNTENGGSKGQLNADPAT